MSESFENDCTKVMCEDEVALQALEKEKHKLNVKACYANKEIVINKIQTKRLKTSLEFTDK